MKKMKCEVCGGTRFFNQGEELTVSALHGRIAFITHFCERCLNPINQILSVRLAEVRAA